MSLVESIQKLCKKRKITIAELERNLGLGNSTIRRWDENKPTADKLVKVADYFDVTTDYLLGRTKYKRGEILEGDKLPPELQGLDGFGLEVIREVADSGLTPKQIRYALKTYKLLKEVYGDEKSDNDT